MPEASPSASPAPGGEARRAYFAELLRNQVWQGLNFVSKIAFLGLLTPLMLRVWGKEKFGLFALASSLIVSLAVLDCGIRAMTRRRVSVALSGASSPAATAAMREGLAAFALVAFGAFVVAAIGAAKGVWGEWFRLPEGGDLVLASTVGMVGAFMVSSLALEPVAAQGRVSELKRANTVGALAAIPLAGGMVWLGCSVTAVVVAYLLCLIAPNVWMLLGGWAKEWYAAGWRALSWRTLGVVYHQGGWYYLTTIALILKTHALTFAVSSWQGAAAAGLFYILLRIAEIIGTIGATSSDTVLASLALATTPAERRERFLQAYHYAAVFSLHGALAIAFLSEIALHLWLGKEISPPAHIGPALAAFGLASAFGRLVVNAAMGLHLTRHAAIGSLIEAACVLGGSTLLIWGASLTTLFALGALASLAMIPCALRLAQEMGGRPLDLYLTSLRPLLPGVMVTLLLLALPAWLIPGLIGAAMSGLAVSAWTLWELRQVTRR